ncbi:MAG: choice-of-anchor D domain-containing protein, partial [Dissulfuribacterales bacterium]
HQFTVSNEGNSGLDINSLTLGDLTNYHVDSDNCSGHTIAGGGSCSITVKFNPQSHGSKNTTLTVHSNVPDKTISLQGTGMASDININPMTINFGAADQHSSPIIRQITVSNQGNLNLENLGVSLNDTTDFSISTNTCGQTLAPGATCTVSIALSMDTIGTHTATVAFASNDADENPVNVSLIGVVLAPQINVVPINIDYGNNPVKTTTASKNILVSNYGNADLAIDPIILDDTTNYHIESDNCSGQTLAPSNACTIAVSFTASTAGAHPAQITVNSNDPNTPSVPVSLSGFGISPEATVTPSAWDFGNVRVNTTSNIQTITISSTGNTALEVNNVSLSDTVNYVKINDACSNQVINIGGTCKVDVAFRPGSTGTKPVTLQVFSNDILNPQVDVSLTGTGIESNIEVTPTSLSFADTVTGQQLAPQTLTIKNTGTASLNISETAIFGGDFKIVSGDCDGRELQTNETCTVSIAFAPLLGSGQKTAECRIGSDDPDERLKIIDLDGTAIEPDMSVSPTSLDFGQNTIGAASPSQNITITNSGTSPMSVGNITVTNPAYTLDTEQCSNKTLDPEASCVVSVTFTPPSRGTFMGSIKIQSDDPDTPEKTVSVIGRGIEPDIYAVPTPLNIGMVPVGQTGQESLVVFNYGNGELAINAIALENNPLFNVTNDACTGQTLGYGETCQITIEFTPVAIGRIETVLNIDSNDPDTPTKSVKVVSEGTVPDINTHPAGIDFGSVTTMTEGYARTFSIRNAGKAPLLISTAVLTDDANYTIKTNTCDNTTLDPGYACSVNIAPIPQISGPIRGYLQVNSNDPDEAQIMLPLDMVSSSPELTIEPTGTILFPDTIKDGFSTPQTITLKNTGNKKLRLSSIFLATNDNYLFDRGNCQEQIAAGDSCEITVTFNPHAEGIIVSALNVESNDPVNPTVAVALSGTALPADVYVFPRSIDFGSIGVGGNSLSSNITVQNQGTVPLDITGIQLSNSNNFQIADDTCSGQTLQSNATCTFTAIFSPVSEGDVEGSILINTSDSNESVVTVPMQGYNPKVVTLGSRSLPVMPGPLKSYYGQWAVNSHQSVLGKDHQRLSGTYNIWAYLKPGFTATININGKTVDSTTPVVVAENYDFSNNHGIINLPAYPESEGTASVIVAVEKSGTPIFEIPVEGWTPEVSLLHNTWSVVQAVEKTIIPFAHNDHCYIVTNDAKAHDNNYNSTRCLVEWTSLPAGLKNNSHPQGLIGYVNGAGEQTIAATLFMYDSNGIKHEVGTLTHQITTTSVEPIKITFIPAYGLPQSATQDEYYTWTGEGANSGTISILSKYNGLHIDITGNALAQDEKHDITNNHWWGAVKTTMKNAWQSGTVTVSASYNQLPENKTTLTLNMRAIPKGITTSLDPYQGDNRKETVLVGHLGIRDAKNRTYTYDEQRDGRWNISLTSYNGSVVYYGPVEYGSENIAADGLFNLNLGIRDAGAYLMKIKAEPAGSGQSVNRVIYSARALIVFKNGNPIHGSITSRMPYASVPFIARAYLRLENWQRKQDIGSITWYESTDGGNTYNKADIPQSDYKKVMGYIKKIEKPGIVWIKAEIKNAWSDEIFEVEPFKLQGYFVPTLTIEGPNTTIVGNPVELQGTTDLVDSSISWKVYAYSLNNDNLVTSSTGKSIIFTPDQVGRYYISVAARQEDAPDVQRAEARTIFVVNSLAPTLMVPKITGLSYTETGKDVELKAFIYNPLTYHNRSSNITLRGEWILPDGSIVPGSDLTENSSDILRFTPKAAQGKSQIVQYRIWVEQMPNIEATGAKKIITWTYVWPEWEMSVKVGDPTAPAYAYLVVHTTNYETYKNMHGEPITYTWHYPEKVKQLNTGTNLSTAKVLFTEEGQYEIDVDISDTRGNITTLATELIDIQPGPTLEAKLKLRTTDQFVPTTLCGDLSVISKPKNDYLSKIHYALDGQLINSCTSNRCCVHVENPGDHTMSVNLTTKHGSECNVQEVMKLQEPPTPVCHLEVTGSLDSSLKAEMICNPLSSGNIQSYRWEENNTPRSYYYPSKTYPQYLLEHYDLQSITVTAITNKGKKCTQSWTAPTSQ